MGNRKIIAIVLVRNEDLYVDRVLDNILDFCDQIIVADHCSTDQTADQVHRLQNRNHKIEYHRIAAPGISHDLISGYAGEDTWVFAVDGDELYDPVGLVELRKNILSGLYDHWWMILGNVLNCTEINPEQGTARGYLAPPCRSMTKLYNFGAIREWPGPCPERLHGGDIVFKPGFTSKKRWYLYKEADWEHSFFRCLHICFIPRSSEEKTKTGQLSLRKNIADGLEERLWDRVKFFCLGMIGRERLSPWKREKYMRGELITKDIHVFFPGLSLDSQRSGRVSP